MNNDILKILKESFGGSERTIQSPTAVLKYSDTPFVKELTAWFAKQQDFQLINIIGNGDMFQMDIKSTIEPELNTQFTREIGKAKAYDIKSQIEAFIKKGKYNIPNLSIQGVKTFENTLEFGISFIYAYKGNDRALYEDKLSGQDKLKVRNLLENIKNLSK